MGQPEPSAFAPILDAISAVLGIVGTYLISKRYTTTFLVFLLLPIVAPILCLLGRGRRLVRYYQARATANQDVPVAAWRIVAGLASVCWAFLLQLVSVFVN